MKWFFKCELILFGDNFSHSSGIFVEDISESMIINSVT